MGSWETLIVLSCFQVQTASAKKAASKKQKALAKTATEKMTLCTPRLELAVEMKTSLMKVESKRELDKLMEQHKNKIAWEKKKATHINWKIGHLHFFPELKFKLG